MSLKFEIYQGVTVFCHLSLFFLQSVGLILLGLHGTFAAVP